MSTSIGSDKGLEKLWRSPKVQTLFIVVPGIESIHPKDWQDPSSPNPWLMQLPDDAVPGLGLFAYAHGLTASSGDTWAALKSSGEDLVSDVQRLRDGERLGHCPIVLVAHSLGGIIVKEAIIYASENSTNHKGFLNTLAGIIFLGTPHITQRRKEPHEGIVFLTQFGTSKKRKTPYQQEEDALVEVSLRFEQFAVHIPILSAYETKKTKLKKQFISSTKLQVLTRQDVQTGAMSESMIGVDADHKGMCILEKDTNEIRQVHDFIRQAVKDTQERIVKGSPKYEVPTLLEAWTYRDEDEEDEDELLSEAGLPPLRTDVKSSSESNMNSALNPDSLDATAGNSNPQRDGAPAAIPEDPSRPKTPSFPIFSMPILKNKVFFGREDVLNLIDSALLSPRGNEGEIEEQVRDFAICGPGGIGKTQVATQWVWTRKDHFDALFWIHADETAKVADAFRRIALDLCLVDEDSMDAEDEVVTRDLVKGWLADPKKHAMGPGEGLDQKASWLIVFDNLDDTDALGDFWPLDGPGCVLFTSRDPMAKQSTLLADDGITLEPFDTNEASRFLNDVTGRQEDSTLVAERLGGLPLAIVQMGSIILRGQLTYTEFLERFNEEDSLEELLQSKLELKNRRDSYSHTLASVWALESLKDSRILLAVLSFLDPDGIQEKLLTKRAGMVKLEKFPKTFSEHTKARTELLQSSLVSRDSTSEKLIIHRLVQDAARSKLNAASREAVFFAAVTLVSGVWPYQKFGWRHNVSRWRLCEAYFPHVLKLRHFAAQRKRLISEDLQELELCRLLTDAGWYIHERGRSTESVAFLEKAQEIAESLIERAKSGNQNPVVQQHLGDVEGILAEVHHDLGCVGTETNDPIATLEHFSRFNELVLASEGQNSHLGELGVAISWNELGNAHMMNASWMKAEDCFLKSIEAAKTRKNFKTVDIALPTVNLGLAYLFSDQTELADQTLRNGLKDREAVFGKDDKDSFITGRFLHALGNLAAKQGNNDESFSFHQRALNQYRATLGSNHHRTGDACVKVSEHLLRLGRPQEALEHSDEAIRIFGGKPVYIPERARAVYKRSCSLEQLGRLEEAKTAYETSVDLYRSAQPQSQPQAEPPSAKDFDDIIVFWSK